jgi:hypothetical protein
MSAKIQEETKNKINNASRSQLIAILNRADAAMPNGEARRILEQLARPEPEATLKAWDEIAKSFIIATMITSTGELR